MQSTLATLTPHEFRLFADFIYSETGIFLAEHKLGLLSNRLRARLKAHNLAVFGDYYARLRDAAFRDEELPYFLSAVTTNETYFFRNERLWQVFEKTIVPEIERAKGASRSVRIWSAASSSGEEAYTVAILLRELLPEVDRWNIAIVGSDISNKMLEKARAGIYDRYAFSRTRPQRISRWFEPFGDGYRIRDELRRVVRFQFHNLRDPFPGSPFDFVLLRNVLMYFDAPMKQRAVRTATDALAPGGYLYVGDVDPLRATRELPGILPVESGPPGLYRRTAGASERERVAR